MAADSTLPWQELAALPETYAVAWSCLFSVLRLERAQTLLIRGATSSLGQAAVHLAVHAGVHVTATTRRSNRIGQLEAMGAHAVEIEGSRFAQKYTGQDGEDPAGNYKRFDAILNLVGNR